MFSYTSQGKPDFSRTQDNEPRDLLPAGFYPARVIRSEEKLSAKGNPMIEMRLIASTPDNAMATTVRYYLPLADNMAWKIDQFLYSIGRGPSLGETVVVVASEYEGATCYVELAVETSQRGNQYNTCVGVMDEEHGKTLASRMTPRTAARREEADTEDASDEIPF